MLESNPLGKKPVKSGIEGVVSCAGEVVLQKAAEFESWRAKKRAEELAIKDNPKIAKELLKRTESIKKEFDRAWERQRKINKKNGGNDWASSAEVSIGEPLISKMNDLLKDYQLFNSTEKYPHASSLGKEFIEHFLSRHDFNHALAVWKFMPDGEWDLGEKILEIMYRNIYDGSEVRYRERIAQGMSVEESQKIRSAYCDKLVASIPEQIEAHPDLSAMNTIGIRYRGSGGSIENRHKAFHRLLSSEEHQSFLKYFSPLSPELQATISPEERVKLFNIFLEKDFNSIVKSFDFFKEDFENLSSERRAEVFGIIGEAINDSLPDYGDGRGSSGIYQIKNAKVDFATFLEHVRISEVDKNNIRGALTPYDFLLRIRNSSNETKPLHLKTEELLFKYNNFILDIARYYPKALILNGGTLLGYANKLNSEPTADDFIENLIVKKKNFVIYELIKNWMHGDGSGSHEEPRFTTDQIVKLGRYIIDEDLPEGIAILSKDPWYIFQISGDMGIALVHHSMKTNNFENIAIFARNLDIISNFDKIFAVELVQHILTGNIQVGIDELASNIHEVANIDANLGAEVVRQLVITNNTDGIYRLLRKIKTIFDFDAQVAKELIEHVLVDEDQNKIYILIEQIGVIASCNADLAIQIVRYVVANQNSEFLINFSKNLSSIPDLVIDSQLQSQIATAFMEYPVAISNMLNCKNNSFSFSRLPMELQEKIGALAIRDGNEKIFIQLVSKNVPLLDASVELGPTISAIRDYNERTKILHSPTARKYVELHLNQGREIADSYIDDLEKNASRLVTKEIPLEERKLPEYRYLVEYVFPAGNYSTHEKNLACGDKLEHLAGYDFQKEGYPVTLTGLLGYRLREGESEDRTLLAQYQQRLKSIREFVASRGPDNKLLQEAFDKKVDDFFERYADSNFQSIPDLSTKEKMIVLFVTEALRKEREVDFSPNQQVLDLIVEYKYAYHENLEAYIQHSASDVAQYKDETSQRFFAFTGAFQYLWRKCEACSPS